MIQFKNLVIVLLSVATTLASGIAAHYYLLYWDAFLGSKSENCCAIAYVPTPHVDTFIDALGRSHSTHQPAEAIARRTAEEVVNNSLRPILDSVSESFSNKHIGQGTEIQGVRDSVRHLVRTLDSQRRITRIYKDQYLTLLVRDPAPDDTTDKGKFDFTYYAELNFLNYSRRKDYFGMPIGRREFFTEITSADPRMKISGQDKLTIQRHMPALGFRIQSMSTYDDRGLGLGLGGRMDIGDRFNAGINYLYSFKFQDWRPALYAKYDLLQLGR